MADERARFEVLLEDLQGTMKFIAEGHGMLVDKIDRMQVDIDDMKSDLSVVKADVAILKSDVAILKSDVADLKPRVARIEHHVGLNGKTPPRARTKKSK